MSGPTQYPATKREMVRIATSWENPKYAIISRTIPDGDDEAKVELRTSSPATPVKYHR